MAAVGLASAAGAVAPRPAPPPRARPPQPRTLSLMLSTISNSTGALDAAITRMAEPTSSGPMLRGGGAAGDVARGGETLRPSTAPVWPPKRDASECAARPRGAAARVQGAPLLRPPPARQFRRVWRNFRSEFTP